MIRSKFLKIVCPRCKRHKIIFNKAGKKVKCNDCKQTLTKTSGGKTKLFARVKEVLWN